MSATLDKTLKGSYMKWLVGLAFLDVLVAVLAIAPDSVNSASILRLILTRGLLALVLPVLVLLVVNVLPHDVKSMLVYWRPRGTLPGCEAFTKYGPRDIRIDMLALKKHVGVLPSDPPEQNAKWYRLFKLVEAEPEVFDAHRSFLMYRDMAVLTLPLIVLVPATLYVIGASAKVSAFGAGLLICQFIVTATSARWSGIRFVCNVLAVHSTKKWPIAKPVSGS
jgi:hypothetical protein